MGVLQTRGRSQIWEHMPLIPLCERQRQENHLKLEDSLVNIAKPGYPGYIHDKTLSQNTPPGACELAQPVKAFTAKLDNLSSISRTIMVYGENQLLEIVFGFCSCTVTHSHKGLYTCTHAHRALM